MDEEDYGMTSDDDLINNLASKSQELSEEQKKELEEIKKRNADEIH